MDVDVAVGLAGLALLVDVDADVDVESLSGVEGGGSTARASSPPQAGKRGTALCRVEAREREGEEHSRHAAAGGRAAGAGG